MTLSLFNALGAASNTATSRHSLAVVLALFERVLRLMRRDPGQIAGAIIFPLIFFALFSLIMARVMAAQGVDYSQSLPAAIIVQAMLFTAMASASAIAADHASGLYARLRTLPISRAAPITARVAGDLVRGSIALIVISIAASLQGMTFSAGLGWVGLFMLMPLGFLAVTSLGMGLLGHWFKNTEAATAMASILYLPLLMLSSAFAPEHLFPTWLQGVVNYSPVTRVIEIMRGCLTGDVDMNSLLTVVAMLAVLGLLFLYLNTVLLEQRDE